MPSLIETAPESARKERVCPPGSWDTHFHIFELDQFELSPRRHFTPAHTPLADFEAFQHKLGIEHPAIAHGLSFGLDISSTYRYLEYFDGTARAFAVIDLETVTDGDLRRMHDAGVRGIRIDYHHHKAQHDLQEQIKCLKGYSARVAPFKWAVQVYHPHPEFWSELAPVVAELPTPVVLDHFGALKTASLANYNQSETTDFDVLQQPGLDAITTLLRSGKLWIKLSAPYRCSEAGPEYHDMEPLVKALVKAHPDRVLYGSDWPHTQPFHRRPKNLEPTDIEPFVNFDDYTWVKTLKTWLSEEEWQKLMQYERND